MKKQFLALLICFAFTSSFCQTKFTKSVKPSMVLRVNEKQDTVFITSDTVKVIQKGEKVFRLDSTFTLHINDAILLGNLLIKVQEIISKSDVATRDGLQIINLLNLFVDEIKKQSKK